MPTYESKRDFRRLVGKVCEAVDKATATNQQVPPAIILDPGTKDEVRVDAAVEPRLPQVVVFAKEAKLFIRNILKDEKLILRSPLDMRGQGPHPRKKPAALPALDHIGGGVQITAENDETQCSVDLRYAVAVKLCHSE